MLKPKLYDVIELLYPLSEENLETGAQGTLVEQHSDEVFEVEFVNEHGETIALCPLDRNQFVVIWQSEVQQTVPLAEQVAQIVSLLPQQAGVEVLDFARFLSAKRRQSSPPSTSLAA